MSKTRNIILFSLLLATPISYSIFSSKKQAETASNPITSTLVSCPTKPTGTLETDKVKPLELTANMTKITGTINQAENIGYIFGASAKQQLLYDKPDDICFWIYKPDGTLLTESIIPFKGRYIIQIADPSSKQKDFTISLGINVPNKEYRDNLTTRYNQDTLSPKAFIINYYEKINQGRYKETWRSLSPSFLAISGSYGEYQAWWQKVQEVKIGRVETTEQSADKARVSIELWYLLKTGREVYDSQKYVHLIWDRQRNSWLIDSKKST